MARAAASRTRPRRGATGRAEAVSRSRRGCVHGGWELARQARRQAREQGDAAAVAPAQRAGATPTPRTLPPPPTCMDYPTDSHAPSRLASMTVAQAERG